MKLTIENIILFIILIITCYMITIVLYNTEHYCGCTKTECHQDEIIMNYASLGKSTRI